MVLLSVLFFTNTYSQIKTPTSNVCFSPSNCDKSNWNDFWKIYDSVSYLNNIKILNYSFKGGFLNKGFNRIGNPFIDSAGNNLKLGSTITYNDASIAVESDSGWISPTLVNSYVASSNPIRYRKIGNWGLIFGSVRRSAPPSAIQTICTLPVGYRPDKGLQSTSLWVYDNLAAQITNISLGTDGVLSTGFIYTLAGTPSGAGGSSDIMIIYRIGG